MATGKDSEKLRQRLKKRQNSSPLEMKTTVADIGALLLAKWLELSGSSPENFDALVDLIVKEQLSPDVRIRRNRHNPNQIHHRDG